MADYDVLVHTDQGGIPLRIECTKILEPSLGLPYRYTYQVYEYDEPLTPPEMKAGDCVEFEGDLYILEYVFDRGNVKCARIMGFASDKRKATFKESRRQVQLDQLTLRYSRSD